MKENCPNCGYDGSAFGPIQTTWSMHEGMLLRACPDCTYSWLIKEEDYKPEEK